MALTVGLVSTTWVEKIASRRNDEIEVDSLDMGFSNMVHRVQ